MSLRERIAAAAKAVPLASLPTPPVVGVVLGSGLGAFGDTLDGLVKTPYASLPGMPQSGVIGHAGNLCLGTVGGASVACLQGRVHAYEGHDLDTVTFGVRLLAAIGCKAILITNAAGGLNATFSPGDLMVISDHLNLTGKNPLIGPNDDTLGPRFPDMTTAYDPALRKLAHEAGREAGVSLREGVYAGLSGPTYETPAEVRMLRTLGADAVGMSTVPEVIVLHHQKVRVVAISCITNLAAGTSPTPLDHKEVEETARATRDSFVGLLRSLLPKVAHAVSEPRPS